MGIISVDFDATGDLLIIYFVLVKYWEKLGIHWGSAAIYGLQEGLLFTEEGGLVKYSHWLWYARENGKANTNVSEWNL